ncbi:MAG: tyrosine-type recombinase/integrase [Candidatus Lokiarchaeia archaeon]
MSATKNFYIDSKKDESIQEWINTILIRIQSDNNNINEYFTTQLKGRALNTQLADLIAIDKLFEITQKNNIKTITKKDILIFLNSEWFNKTLTKDTSRKIYLSRINKYLRYSKRTQLADLINPKQYNGKPREINENELITREDLELILKNSNLKLRTLIIVMYEGALRRGEVLGIKFKHITFKGDYANLFVKESKTKERNIPLFDSIPYLKEWFNANSFEQDDYIFEYKSARNLNSTLIGIKKRLIEKYGNKWESKPLNPHIFRHSRLTELAIDDFNEPSLRKFAGWTKDSQMAKIYFHITDQDLIKKMRIKRNLETKPKETKPKTHEPKYCSICKAENGNENVFCWKCNHTFDNGDIIKEFFIQPERFRELETENKQLKEKMHDLTTKFLKLNKNVLELLKDSTYKHSY